MYLSITILKLQYSHGKWITKLFNGLSFERKSWNKCNPNLNTELEIDTKDDKLFVAKSTYVVNRQK